MKYRKTIRASKSNRASRSTVSASREMAKRRAVKSDEDIDISEEELDIPADAEGDAGAIDIDPAASELLFETEDVANIIAEFTGDDVEVTVDDEGDGAVTFAAGENEITVTPDGDEEVVESSSKLRRARRVSAARRMSARRPARRVSAARRSSARSAAVARRVSASRRSSAARRPSTTR